MHSVRQIAGEVTRAHRNRRPPPTSSQARVLPSTSADDASIAAAAFTSYIAAAQAEIDSIVRRTRLPEADLQRLSAEIFARRYEDADRAARTAERSEAHGLAQAAMHMAEASLQVARDLKYFDPTNREHRAACVALEERADATVRRAMNVMLNCAGPSTTGHRWLRDHVRRSTTDHLSPATFDEHVGEMACAHQPVA